tara:strand:- start:41 stop:829 length:789 start_codon:yes stop_codon:yes gene_type:complete
MKKFLILILFTPFFSFGQNPVKVQVTQQKTFAQSFNDGLKSGAAVSAAAAANRNAAAAQASAQSEALKNNSEVIQIDLLKGSSDKYKYLVIKRVSGWGTSGNFVTITNEINSAKRYQIVSLNNLGMYSPNANAANATSKDRQSRKEIKQIDENQFYEPLFPQKYLNDSETLFLEWSREAITPIDRLSRLTLKNSFGETVYQAEYKNKGYSEMLRPLLSDYNFGKEDAKNKLIELKEYLDLGIITQEEFDKKAKPLKKILIGN